MRCPDCAGDGWYADHNDGCYGNCENHGCPIQRPCLRCHARGQVDDMSAWNEPAENGEQPF